MNNNYELRDACAKAIRQCLQAEQKTKWIQDAANQQRQIALTETRRKYSQMHQQVKSLLGGIHTQTEEAHLILSKLNLKPEQPTPMAPPQIIAGLHEFMRLLHNHRSQANAAFISLKAAADALKAERRKWWKFW